MKTLLRVFICGLFAFQVTTETIGQKLSTIYGEIKDFKNGKVILFEALTRDTLAHGKIVDHHFTLIPKRGEVSGQALPAMLLCLKDDATQSTAAPVAIEDTDMTIILSGDGTNTYQGSPWQKGYSDLIYDLRQADMKMTGAPTESEKDSIQKMITSRVETFYLDTRNSSFKTFMSLVLFDFINRKFIKPEDLIHLKSFCKEGKALDSLEQIVCEAILESETGWEGKQPPEFEGHTLNGELIRLSEVIGSKPVIVDFWASWCGPCIREMPDLKRLYAEGKVEIIGVSIDDQIAPWQKSLERLNLSWINILDDGKMISKKYNVTAVPAKFVINQEGIIVSHNPEDIRSVLESLY